MTPTLRLAALCLGTLLFTSSCASLGKAVGAGKNPPDEFAITTKAPLTVPPDYALRPPKPGETRPEEKSTTDRARELLIGDASAAPPSQGELALIQNAGALDVDSNIRAILAAENGGRASKNESLANQILFWHTNKGEIDDSAAPLRVEDEGAWMAERRRSIESVTGGGQVTIAKDDRGVLNLPGVN
ncbi:DUF3035 domain-containing protein [Parvularcula dongshanensis]|uniref:DUF3035 domain-containing protein n=1 Tax=Parvularcula dongshanensis TaxID=1173995 RepID=A0A840I1X6_9PROT|nr:DUF3035 domain-containing protein [Parvularcula dongshanensis]MBB4658819.1 hypothetical protein [Parvularcula dongshanensis]